MRIFQYVENEEPRIDYPLRVSHSRTLPTNGALLDDKSPRLAIFADMRGSCQNSGQMPQSEIFSDNSCIQRTSERHSWDLKFEVDSLNAGDSDCGSIPNRSDLSAATNVSTASRKSRFREGSMNETSKALASAWSDGSNFSVCSIDDDLEVTPRPSRSDCASRSSSHDLRDFGPAMEKSTVFKQTLKRITRKSTTTPSVSTTPDAPTPYVDDGTIKAKVAKNGGVKRAALRRSISYAKIFAGSELGAEISASDYRDTATTSTTNEDDVLHRVKTTPSVDFSTLSLRKDVTSQGSTQNTDRSGLRLMRLRSKKAPIENDAAVLQKSVFDERKRKAEVAYAEQFGTVKRIKNENLRAIRPGLDDGRQAKSIKAKKRSGWNKAAFETVRSIFYKANSNENAHQITSIGTADSTAQPVFSRNDPASLVNDGNLIQQTERVLPPVSKTIASTLEAAFTTPSFVSPRPVTQSPTISRAHARIPSHTSTTSAKSINSHDTDLDRSKQRSYSQLEKENQKLRALLREKEAAASSTIRYRGSQSSIGMVGKSVPTSMYTSDEQRHISWKHRRQTEKWSIHEDSNTMALDATIIRVRNPTKRHDIAVLAPTTPTSVNKSNGNNHGKDKTKDGVPLLPTLVPVSLAPDFVKNTEPKKRHYTADISTITRCFERPRPLSMVLEGREDEKSDDEVEITRLGRSDGTTVQPWVWDEDVF